MSKKRDRELMRRAVAMNRVFLGYPSGGSVHAPFAESLIRLQAEQFGRPEHERTLGRVATVSGLYIAENRQELARQFLKTDLSWLLMVDSDISFPENIVDVLLYNTLGGRFVVAGNVPLGNAASVAYKKIGYVWAPFEEIPSQKVFECDAVATAVLMIHRTVLEKIGDSLDPSTGKPQGEVWFNHFYYAVDGDSHPRGWPRYLSVGEDLAFSVRAREAGFALHVVRGIPGLKHHKTRALFDDYVEAS